MAWFPIGNCAICGRHRELVQDHDHKTKYNRGKLCISCNSGLGMFQDSEIILLTAGEYLSYWKRNPSKQVKRQRQTNSTNTQKSRLVKVFKELPEAEQERLLKGSH